MIAIAQPGGKTGGGTCGRGSERVQSHGAWYVCGRSKQGRRAPLAELSSKDGQKRFNMRLRVNNRKRALT